MKTIIIFLTAFLLTSCFDKQPSTSPKVIDTFKVEVNEKGYVPSVIKISKTLKTVKLLFTRTTDKTCAREVVLEELNINKKLPLNQEIAISFDVKGSKELVFGCHMDKMFSGRIILN